MNLQPPGALKFWHRAIYHTMELYKFNLSYSLRGFWIPFSWMDCSFSTACLSENSSHRCYSAIFEREEMGEHFPTVAVNVAQTAGVSCLCTYFVAFH